MDYLYQDKLKCDVKLLNKDLWDSFYKLNTEMIITKPGRRMFPSMRIQVSALDPTKDYCFLVEMVPVSKCRYRYSASTGWAPAGAEEAHSPNRFYVHPESPAPGAHWMSQAVSFGRLKLTNMSNAPAGHLVMASMHKYQPRIHIIETADLRAVFDYAPKAVVDFAETQFIAVTAYQNDKMTKMKIDHNPFAKGFRESGQSKCKRKRLRLEQEKLEKLEDNQENCQKMQKTEIDFSLQDDDVVDVVGNDDLDHNLKVKSSNHPLDVSSDSGLSDCDTESPQHKTAVPTSMNVHNLYNPYFYHNLQSYQLNQLSYPYYSSYSHFYPVYPSPPLTTTSYSSPPLGGAPEDLSLSKTKHLQMNVKIDGKFTDFSIRAITGLV